MNPNWGGYNHTSMLARRQDKFYLPRQPSAAKVDKPAKVDNNRHI